MATFRVAEKDSQKELGFYEADDSGQAVKEAKEDPRNEENIKELVAFEISLAC